jgi:O-antigen/teichoic acid export membrane protein
VSESISRKALRGALYGFIGWVFPITLSFFATRILVLEMGTEEYGIYSLIVGFISYLFVFNLSRAVTKHVAASTQESSEVISTTFFLSLVVASVIAVSILVLSNRLTQDILRVDAKWQVEVIKGLKIAAISVFFLMIGQTFIAIIHGLQRFDIYSKITSAINLLLIIGNVVIVLYGHGFLALLIWNLFIVIFNTMAFYTVSRRLLPELQFFKLPRKTAILEVFKYGGSNLGYQILANLFFLFERSWIIRNFGSSELSYYALPMTVAIQMHFFITSFIQFAFPLASELNNDPKRLEQLYTKGIKYVFLMTLFLAAFLILQRKAFLHLWLNDAFVEKSGNLLVIHVITYSLIALIGIIWSIFDGIGLPHISFISYSISFVLGVVLMLSLGIHGIDWVGITRLISTAVLLVFALYFERMHINNRLLGFWIRLLTKGLIIILFFVALNALLESFNLSPSISLSVFLFISLPMYFLLLLLLRLITFEEIAVFKVLSKLRA